VLGELGGSGGLCLRTGSLFGRIKRGDAPRDRTSIWRRKAMLDSEPVWVGLRAEKIPWKRSCLLLNGGACSTGGYVHDARVGLVRHCVMARDVVIPIGEVERDGSGKARMLSGYRGRKWSPLEKGWMPCGKATEIPRHLLFVPCVTLFGPARGGSCQEPTKVGHTGRRSGRVKVRGAFFVSAAN